MLSILMYEDVVTRGDIGRGMGGLLGRIGGGILGAAAGVPGGPFGILGGAAIGRALGGQIGRYTGGAVISDPEKAADFEKASHRVGHLANPSSTAYGAVGDAISGDLGLTDLGAGIYNASSDEGARKLGYGTAGRVGSFFTPLAGLFRPDKVAANR